MTFEIRKDRRPQGRKILGREREEYFRLMDQGLSNREACRIVGIDRRTGMRWRNGWRASGRHKGSPPVKRPGMPESPSRYLREADRIHIADRLRENASIRTIAKELGRSPSTVSREIRRNGTPGRGGRLHYRPHAAQSRADARRPRPKPGKIGQSTELQEFIQQHLSMRWSPEQIVQQLRRNFPDRPEMNVVHETIYQALYVQGRGELRRELTRALRTGRAMRKPRRQAQQRAPRFPVPMVMISDRPAEAADRAVPGHWEGDLIIGKNNGSAIGTLVERSTRYLMLVHLPNGRAPHLVRDALLDTILDLPAQLKRSLTWDQGVEMGRHHEFATAADMPVYFCDPASPWQRGSNENTNGLLRQYFPKGTDLAAHTREHLDAVATELNTRPRKTLGWQTPAERMHTLLATTSN
ncbi:IS30 family transposase [Streptomyces sp. Ag82_O1-15]|uniref:IS30 family transposase n=1 Tax=Streptomyces sp. Ag82_O1-15 TaxID=1938855 RepID=UPI000BB13211|nr:IS30 family transposase [Streptomyces sp. Ag82_O1-15]PBC87103.1 IS30 family transposase [Streptomyces sp. Ag82_O1-15]PBC93535.1 IS30 family transposase [Streptomyces sp. Ag82_O1-15]PBC94523.1 IS30 family transposase [Streptomyces sp. Ag82_O1-15]